MSALDFLYVRFAEEVRDEVQKIWGDVQAADDLTQSVFAGLSSPLQSYEATKAPFHTSILRMARNATLDRAGLSRPAL